jgi:biotin carboxylase
MLDIVVQRIASFRIDPLVLRRPGHRLAIVTTASKFDYLERTGALVAFDHVTVLEDDEFDEATLADAVRTLAQDVPMTEVALLCHDEYALLVAAAVREALGLAGPTPAQIRPFTDKSLMKQCVASAGIRIPRFEVFDPNQFVASREDYLAHLEHAIGLPAFVKPTGESGAVGAESLESREQLARWAERVATRKATGNTTEYEVDEFVTGRLFHVDTLIEGDRVIHVGCNGYLHPLADYAKEKVCSSFTLSEDDEIYSRLVEFNARVLRAFPDKPSSGAFHHEVFERDDGELVFLEIAARAPAALVPQTGRIRWGVDIEEAHFRLLQGEPVSVPAWRGPYAGFVYYPKTDGRVFQLTPPTTASSSLIWMPNVVVGQQTSASADVRDFAASVLLWNADHDQFMADLQQLGEQRPVIAHAATSRSA